MAIGDEERQFVNSYIATGNMELAARGTIVDVDASPAAVKRTAMQALGDTDVKAYFIDLMEEVNLTPRDMMDTIKRNLTVKNYALHQATGNKVEIGDNGPAQLIAAKLLMQGMGLIGGGVKADPSDRAPAPAVVNIVFPVRQIRSSKEDTIIDGDDIYSAS